MIQRNLLTQLRAWKAKDTRKPLVLRGARQVGKTTLINEFGREFDYYINLNLEHKEDARAFSYSDNVKDIFLFICLQKKILIRPDSKVLLFIDEIQNEPKAVAMLRYFYEDMPSLYVIAAGSRLQTLLKQRISFPVGRIEYMSLRPCSFLEFLRATDNERLAEMAEYREVPEMLHNMMSEHFNKYALVGGMPEAVADYAEHNDINRLSVIYDSLVKGYNEDVEKYARNDTQVKIIRHILRHGWSKAGQTIKFVGFGGSTYSSKEIHEAFDVMQKAFLLHLDYPVTSVQAPAIPSTGRSPKLIWLDNGIMNFSAGIQIEYLKNTDLQDVWRGHAAEHIVAQELRIVLDKRHREEQHFWVRDKKGASAEVDFVWQDGIRLIPIEVKTGTNSHLRSLHSYMSYEESPDIAVRIWGGPYSVDDVKTASGHHFRLINIPFYYVCMIDDIIKEHSR